MNKTERIFKIEQLISARKLVSFQALLDEIEVSRATLKRDLEYLRSRMKTPIIYDREANGYRFEGKGGEGDRVEFPGLWFNASEAAALLTMHHLLANIQPGMLARHIEPLRERLKSMLESADHSFKEVQRRVRIIHLGRRAAQPKYFEIAASALLNRRRLTIDYYARASNEVTTRDVSPQRLVCYRENWYLDAWCHLRNDLRSFSLDGIRKAELLESAAKNVAESDLEEFLAAGYGIFSGRKTTWATLKFSPTAARWVASEKWHSRQKSRTEADGSYVLEIPYSEDRELVMDILRWGPDAEVISPEPLRNAVAGRLKQALRPYRH
jgi:predicted DNA-binding transcriptional regulator YafY